MRNRFLIEIEVDEKTIRSKYPNFNINWDNERDFIESTIKSFVFINDDDMSKVGLKKWGYAIRVIREVE